MPGIVSKVCSGIRDPNERNTPSAPCKTEQFFYDRAPDSLRSIQRALFSRSEKVENPLKEQHFRVFLARVFLAARAKLSIRLQISVNRCHSVERFIKIFDQLRQRSWHLPCRRLGGAFLV